MESAAYNSPELTNIMETIGLRLTLKTATVQEANSLLPKPSQSDFDLAVEENNLPVVMEWRSLYGYKVDIEKAVRANSAEMLDLADSDGWDDDSDIGYSNLLLEVGKVHNFFFVQKYLRSSWPVEEFVKAGWLEGLALIVRNGIANIEEDTAVAVMNAAVERREWTMLALVLSVTTDAQKKEIADLINDKLMVFDVNLVDRGTVLEIFSRYGVHLFL